MRGRRIGIGVAGAAVMAALSVGAAVADDGEITGPAADQARAAAVKAIPGAAGKVEKETNEGAAYYGILVTKPDRLDGRLDIDCPTNQYIRADPDDLDRIIGNLIDNATQHGATPVTIHVQPTPDGVEIRVSDHGPGFPPGFLPQAFLRFTRADTARTTSGAGLGLAIVDTLTRRNHGSVTAHNHVAGGAEITVSLPAAAHGAD